MNAAVRDGRLVLRNGRIVVGDCPECCQDQGPCSGYFPAQACPVDRVGQPNACAYPEPPFAVIWVRCSAKCQDGSALFTPEPDGQGGTIYRGKTISYAGWCFQLVDVPDPNVGTPFDMIPPSPFEPVLLDDAFACVAGCGSCDQNDDVFIGLQPCECTLAGNDTGKYVCAEAVFEALNRGLCYVIVRQAASGAMVCYQPNFANVIVGEENIPPGVTVYGRNGADRTEFDDCCDCCDVFSDECSREYVSGGEAPPGYTDQTVYPFKCCCDPSEITGVANGVYVFDNPGIFSERREMTAVCVSGVWTITLDIYQNGTFFDRQVTQLEARCVPPINGLDSFGIPFALVGGGVHSGTYERSCTGLVFNGQSSGSGGRTSTTAFNLAQAAGVNPCAGKCGQSVGGAGVRDRQTVLDALEGLL